MEKKLKQWWALGHGSQHQGEELNLQVRSQRPDGDAHRALDLEQVTPQE